MMKLALASLLVLTATASAGDSSWLLCKGVGELGKKGDVDKMYFAASLVEHRDGAEGRALEVALMKGTNVSSGSYKGDGDSVYSKQTLKVTQDNGKRIFFTGTGELPMSMKTFTLDGKLDSSFGADAKPSLVPFHAKLSCELLDDLAIGH
jgi:hypothetical protein